MKKYFTGFLLIFCISSINCSKNYVSPFVEKIGLRVYFSARLQRAIKLLKNFTHIKDYTIKFESSKPVPVFTHTHIRKAYDELLNEKSLSYFFEVWTMFERFKCMADDDFEPEFIRLTYLILGVFQTNKRTTEEKVIERQNKFSLLECIDNRVDVLLEQDESLKKNSIFQHTNITLDDIAFRFYIIQRIRKSVNAFQEAIKLEIDKKMFNTRDNFLTELENYCTHIRIIDVLKKIILEKNLSRFLVLFEDIKNFRFIDDERFLKEMLMTMYTTYKNMILKNYVDEFDKETIAQEMMEIWELYEKIDLFSFEEILEKIDDATSRLSEIIEKIENVTWYGRVFNWFLQKIKIRKNPLR